MKFHFERSGGFTGIPLRMTIDSDALSSDEGAALESMVQSADFFHLSERIQTNAPGADRFSYKLTVETSSQIHTVQVSEESMPEGLRPLIQRINSLARGARKG